MSAATETMPVVARGEGHLIQIQLRDEHGMPSAEAKQNDLLSEVVAATTDSASASENAGSQTPLNWDKSLSFWLSTIIGYFGQQFMNYITGVSEKMEKLEYY